MICCFGEQQRWKDVKGLFGRMQSQGLLPNVVTYTTLVDIYGKSGRFDDAIECLDVMKSTGLKPPTTMYNALINAYAQKVEMMKELELKQLMVSLSLSGVSLGLMLNFLCPEPLVMCTKRDLVL